MSYSITKQNDDITYNLVELVADTPADLASLPTTFAAGSTVLIISTSETYILDNSKEWQLKESGGGGGDPHAITYDKMDLTSAQQKQVRENIAAPAYADIIQPKKIKDYLYEVEFTDIDWEYGKDFERNKRTTSLGACSSARAGNWFGRNYDWNYDETDYYIIRMHRSKTAKYWSIGMTGFTDITPDTYRALPFITLDGINECGVFANINILPSDASYTTTGTTPLVSWEDTLGAVMLPRFILDNFATAEEAVEYIQNYISVYCKEQEELHLMIGDSTTTYLMEFIDNAIVVTEMTERPYMTNFYLQGSEVDSDGHIDYDTVGDYSFGLERYDMLADGISGADNLEGMTALMNSINWTNAYSTEMDPIWKTEFVTPELGLTIHSSLEDFAEVLTYERMLFANRTRDGQTWQTCHTTVYDIQNKVMYLQTQEDAEQIKVEYRASDELSTDVRIVIGQYLQPFDTPLKLVEDSKEGDFSAALYRFANNYYIYFGSSSGGASYLGTGTYNYIIKYDGNIAIIPGHKYFVISKNNKGSYDGTHTARLGIKFSSTSDVIYVADSIPSGASVVYRYIATCDSSIEEPELYIVNTLVVTSATALCQFSVQNFCLLDLTDLFGAGNEPSTVEEAEALLPDQFYAFSDKSYKLTDKANMIDPLFSGSINFGRKAETTPGPNSVALGYWVTSSGQNSFAEGEETISSGRASHAEGYDTTASGNYSHAEGNGTTASSHASHAEGYNTTASGVNSHAEGDNATASGESSHAEGKSSTASGAFSHTEGNFTKADGNHSHAEGWGTKASSSNQHVEGRWNIEDTNNDYAHIVGNGTSSVRSNAYTLDWYGNGVYTGTVTATNIPAAPTTNGSYQLTCDVVDGIVTYSWKPIITASTTDIDEGDPLAAGTFYAVYSTT